MKASGLIRQAFSVAAGATILYGCATEPVRIETDVVPGRVVPGHVVPGHITTRAGKLGHVIAAPHGTSDARTGDIAADLAHRTGFGLVVATGFTIESGHRDTPGRRYQVNRPLEGVPGTPAAQEVATDEARRVYEIYEQRVREIARGPIAFYAEIHGNTRQESATRIEIATVGIDRPDAMRLKTLLEMIRDAHLRGRAASARLDVLIEPADPLVYSASSAKRVGILRFPTQGLHIELPRAARTEWRDLYTAILADFLAQAAALPPRPR